MSKFLHKLRGDLDTKYCGHCANANGKIKALGENARRMLEIGIVQDELVNLGFEYADNTIDLMLFTPKQDVVVIAFKRDMVLVDGWKFKHTSPTFRKDVINKAEELINETKYL